MKLIIDGCNLFNLLYFNSKLNQSHGGDYDGFKRIIHSFVQALRDCDIDPYVVLDGGSNSAKLETRKLRAQSRIDNASKLSLGLQGSVLPTLWRKVSLHNERSQRYILCKRYTATSFCRYFNIKKQLLPVFAAVTGNDYVKLRKMDIILRWEEYSSMEGSFARFYGLLSWLASFKSPKEALDSVLKLIDSNYNRQMMALAMSGLTVGIDDYQVPSGFLERFFNNGVAPAPCLLPEPHRVLPDWTLLLFMKGGLPSCMLDVLLMRTLVMSTQVQDMQMSSANITSRPIRQVFYGLLLAGKKESQSSQEPPGGYVEEYDREGRHLTSSMVEAVQPSALEHFPLDKLDQAPHSVRCEVFLETLGVSSSSLIGVPPKLRLPVAVTCYWLRHAKPQPDQLLLNALLLGLVYGVLCSQRAKGPDKLFERLRSHIQNRAGGPDLAVAHAYSQWQCCLRDSLHLNQLLLLPLAEPQCAWLYKGTLLHQLVADLDRGTLTPDSLLLGSSSSERLYRALLDAVHTSHAAGSTVSGAIPSSLRKPQDDLMTRLEVLALEEEDDDAGGAENPKQEDDGLPGVKGHPGFPGEEGENGDRGSPGPAGPLGLRGCPGMRGVKGSRGYSGNKTTVIHIQTYPSPL
ncbi:hypothetical protein DPEC_G00140990 [Dallia pectoralis]|uniref:Uncharacterized protein n=1 Tax=Dallia pectoralis TaxID=75939 RepID=A0ACC2GMW6_DALPE|nr:hypothetical protein DPEC_G00140990 [Dallia pectoralis]